MIGLPRIHRIPVQIPPLSCGAPGGSSASIRPRNVADQKNDTASTASAYGPRRSCTSVPPRLLPTRNEAPRVPLMSELALT